MVARGSSPLVHADFRDLPAFLRRGDLLVVNESATLPAALPATRADGTSVELHLSTPEPPAPGRAGPDAGRWVVELRRDGARLRGGAPASRSRCPAAAARSWSRRISRPGACGSPRSSCRRRCSLPRAHGRRSATPTSRATAPLADHQTMFARVPGSAEMPSAGRPFRARVLAALAARGIGVAPLVLHTGVSSQERGERPYPERFTVPAATAARVDATRRAGGRVIAVGTTVTRALETAAAPGGGVRAASGWTSLMITPERGVRAVDGLVTGWHEPAASHLLLLEAVAGRELVERSYEAVCRRATSGTSSATPPAARIARPGGVPRRRRSIMPDVYAMITRSTPGCRRSSRECWSCAPRPCAARDARGSPPHSTCPAARPCSRSAPAPGRSAATGHAAGIAASGVDPSPLSSSGPAAGARARVPRRRSPRARVRRRVRCRGFPHLALPRRRRAALAEADRGCAAAGRGVRRRLRDDHVRADAADR